MQEIGNCDALQFVQSFEISPDGVMWIIDVGRQFDVNSASTDGPADGCPAKLVLLDLNSNAIVRTHVFPDSVVDRKTNFLNDVVVDLSDPDRVFAYISNAFDGAIVVYDFANDKSWSVKHESTAFDPDVRYCSKIC